MYFSLNRKNLPHVNFLPQYNILFTPVNDTFHEIHEEKS